MDCPQPQTNTLYENRQTQTVPIAKVSNSVPFTTPNLSSCLVQWKLHFPWVNLEEVSNSFICTHCHSLMQKVCSGVLSKAVVFVIKKPEDAFEVAKHLRDHHLNVFHRMTNYFSNYAALISLVNVHGNLFGEIQSESDLLQYMKIAFDTSSPEPNVFYKFIEQLGSEIETQLLKRISKCMFFSVVADQCRGLVIFRIVEHNLLVEEFVLWSYLNVLDVMPMHYMTNQKMDLNKLSFYIANTPCQQCSRCANTRISAAQLPPRAPPITGFCRMLWNYKVLRGLNEAVQGLIQLWSNFPHKFEGKCGNITLSSLKTYETRPTVLLDLFENFHSVQMVASNIYTSLFRIDALGFSKLHLNRATLLMKVLKILEEIIVVIEGIDYPNIIHRDQIFRLNQALGSLRSTLSANIGPGFSREESINFVGFVEKFIDENQKSFYYSGRDKVKSFYEICDHRCLLDDQGLIDETKVSSILDIVYMAVNVHGAIKTKENLVDSVLKFHNMLHEQHRVTTDVLSVMAVFKRHPEYKETYSSAFYMYVIIASLPFHQSHKGNDLFIAGFSDQKYSESFWSNFKPELKHYFLYLHDHLKKYSLKTVLEWWHHKL